MKNIIVITFLLFMPVGVEALEIDVAAHLKSLELSSESIDLPYEDRKNIKVKKMKKYMDKYFLAKWSNEALDIKIGLASNSVLLLIDNKKNTFLQYKFILKDQKGNLIEAAGWYDLAPQEINHIGGSFLNRLSEVKKLTFSIVTREKVFSSDVEKHLIRNINQTHDDKSRKLMEDVTFDAEVLYFYKYGRKEGRLNLEELDSVLDMLHTKRGHVKIPTEGLTKEESPDQLITSLMYFHNKHFPNTSYYYFSETWFGPWAGQINGVTYGVLFKIKNEKVELIFESENKPEGMTVYKIYQLYQFPDSKSLFVTGNEIYGVGSADFAAKLESGKLVDFIYYNEEEEGGWVDCSENPFPCG